MSLFQIVILAVVQGVAEFLPISSSGHLVVVEMLMTQDWSTTARQNLDLADVNIMLHLGTLLSILAYYRRRVTRLMFEDRRVLGLMVVGTIPAVIIGLTIKVAFEHWLESPWVAGSLLPVTGLMLLAITRFPVGEKTYEQLSVPAVLLIGLFQAIAVLPGISRSGATIVAGLLVGLRRESAATFSFLLAIPAILGASVLESKSLLAGDELMTPPGVLLVGVVVSFAVGLLSLAWLMRWLERGRLHFFAYWCIPLGIGVLAWSWWASRGS